MDTLTYTSLNRNICRENWGDSSFSEEVLEIIPKLSQDFSSEDNKMKVDFNDLSEMMSTMNSIDDDQNAKSILNSLRSSNNSNSSKGSKRINMTGRVLVGSISYFPAKVERISCLFK